MTLRAEAQSASTLAIAGGVVAGASLVAAGVFWFTSGSHESSPNTAIRWNPVMGAGRVGLDVSGSW